SQSKLLLIAQRGACLALHWPDINQFVADLDGVSGFTLRRGQLLHSEVIDALLQVSRPRNK
ncbi:MAG: hypothetical protein ACTSYX_03725, partial [Candidatus Thorarchaeota archaeon]